MGSRIGKALLLTTPAFTLRDSLDINPLPPLGLAYIAAILEGIGIQTEIYDPLIEGWDKREEVRPGVLRVGATFDEIKRRIIDFAPDIVGVSNLFSKQHENARRIYALAKMVNPNIITVAGGAHPTVVPELVMQDKNVDYIVMGEGENTIRGLVQHLEGRKDISEINGIAFRQNGGIRVIPKTSFIEELDSVPFPAWHLLNMEKYFGLEISHGKRRHRLFSPIVTSRGCPAGCTFCSAHRICGRRYRKRSPENIIEEMRQLKNKYGIKELLFEDDNLTLDIQRAEKIFDMMSEEAFSFEWDTPNGVAAFSLNERLIRKMKEAGCYKLNLAIESGNQDVLKNIIRKPLNLEKVKPLVEYARSVGLEVGIFLIIGMPGERIGQMWDSFRFAKDLGIYDPFISIATPYPGSELYDECIKRGYLRKDFSLDDLYISSFSISTRDWNSKELKKTFKNGWHYLQFHFYKKHPVILFKKIIKKLLRIRAIKNLCAF